MLRIGDFSQLAQVSIRALRIYDEMGLLKPVRVDKFNGYRYYETDQLPRLNRILALKDLGFSLEQISHLLDGELSAEKLRGMLMMKQAEIERELNESQMRLMRVEARLRQIEREGKIAPYEVTVKEVSALTIASLRKTMATFEEMVAARCPMYTDIYEWVETNQLTPLQPELAIYDNPEYVEMNIHLELAVAVEKKSSAGRSKRRDERGVELRHLEGVKQMASVIHHGKFIEAGDALTALYQWVGENGYETCGAYRELHLFGRELDVMEEDVVTIEIQIPFK